jgi:hypothetical protein
VPHGPREPHHSLEELFDRIAERCDSGKIGFAVETNEDRNRFARLEFPSGRDTRKLLIRDVQEADALLGVPFERYRFLSGYDAICSYEDDYLEAAIRPVGITLGAARFEFMRRFLPPTLSEEPPKWPADTVVSDESGGVTLEIGRTTAVLDVLGLRRGARQASIKVKGSRASDHDDAIRILESYSNSLFFQIDAKWGIPIQLTRRAGAGAFRRRKRPTATADELSFPHSVYDPEPMSLFWYARGATGMPLLQFLAYYQVVEFYFPIYAQKEVRRRLRNIVTSPTFSPHSERELGRIVDVLSSSSGRSVWGDERSQLLATLRDCLDGSSIRELISDKRHSGHFDKKIKHLASATLRSASTDDELVTRATERIYEIRCKIVHTKENAGEEDLGLLLPFSAEADSLWPDIELVELAARCVLTAAGKAP